MSVIVILLVAGTGLLVGSRVAVAHDDHERFSRYRAETNSSFGAWLKSAVTAAIFIAVVILLIYDFTVQ